MKELHCYAWKRLIESWFCVSIRNMGKGTDDNDDDDDDDIA